MAGNGYQGRGHHEDVGDGSLFLKQHPTAPPRFSSPSRPRLRDPADDGFKTIAVWAAVSTWLQGTVWVALGAAALCLYYGLIGDEGVEQRWDDWKSIIVNLYFKENAALPAPLPHDLVTPSQMFYFAAATVVANALMWFTSLDLMTRLSCCSSTSPGALLGSVVMWALTVVAVTVVDAGVAAAMVRDLVLLEGIERDYTGDFWILRLCPGAVLILALRGGVLLLANVVCMLLVLRRLQQHRKAAKATKAPQPATVADAPIDGYLYRNGERDNPAYVPDDTQPQQLPWKTFKPDREEQRGHQDHYLGPRANGHKGHDLGYRSMEDPDDISSDLMWMEEIDKHVDVRVRRHVEDRPPPHHRLGLFEDRFRQYPEPFPSGRLVGALGPQSPGPMPVGYPESQGLRLPRSSAHATTPYQLPSVPPVDYSPPQRRRTNAGAADRALAEGRAVLRPVPQGQRHIRY